NGEDNRDGAHDNLSSNYGVEGPTEDAGIVSYRDRVKRSMLTSLLCAMGTPMLQMGDECGRTQRGNNNAYCQDNELSWFDWTLPDSGRGAALVAFVSRLSGLRRKYGSLRSNQYLGVTEAVAGVAELSWWDERGRQLSKEDWDNQDGRVLILRRAHKLADGRTEITALMMNASSAPMESQLPGEFPWELLLDTGNPDLAERPLSSQTYEIKDRAAILLACILPA